MTNGNEMEKAPEIKGSSPPVLTIGLPVFNGEKFLETALRSLLDQSFREFELILSDNASTDKTPEICEEFSRIDRRVRYVRHDINRGAIWNFNYVLMESRAGFFMWAAHDDLWSRDWVLKLMRNFEKSVSISFGHVVIVDSEGKIIRTYPPFYFGGSRPLRLLRFYLAEGKKGKANIIYGIHRTHILQKIGLKIYNNSSFGSDMHLVFNCLQHGRIRTDGSVLLYKRFLDPGESSEEEGRQSVSRSVLFYRMVKYYYSYLFIPECFQDKLVIAFLFPVKVLKGLFYNLMGGR